jgi:Tfp pilus assembly protein PilX
MGNKLKVSGLELGTRNFELGTFSRQDGAALAVGLVFLLVLTIFGISSLSTTLLEEKMSANVQEQNRSFQTAEAGATQRYADIVNTVGTVADLSAKTDCGTPAMTTSEPNPECTIANLGEVKGGVRGGGAFADEAALSGDLNRSGAMSYSSSNFHYRINSEAVSLAKAKSTVHLGVAISRPSGE